MATLKVRLNIWLRCPAESEVLGIYFSPTCLLVILLLFTIELIVCLHSPIAVAMSGWFSPCTTAFTISSLSLIEICLRCPEAITSKFVDRTVKHGNTTTEQHQLALSMHDQVANLLLDWLGSRLGLAGSHQSCQLSFKITVALVRKERRGEVCYQPASTWQKFALCPRFRQQVLLISSAVADSSVLWSIKSKLCSINLTHR